MKAFVVGLILGLALANCAAPRPARAESDAPVDVVTIIDAAAERNALDAGVLVRLAACESGLDPTARSPWNDAGLFQFATVTWPWASQDAGYAGASPFDAEANAGTAAYLLALGQWQHWGTCGRLARWGR